MQFEQNHVLYHYPINHDKLVIGKFCFIACGVRFLFNSANHTLSSLSTYPFPLFFEKWGLDRMDVTASWDNKGDIIIGNDVWIGHEAVILAGVIIGDGANIGTRAVLQKMFRPIRLSVASLQHHLKTFFKWWDWPKEKITQNIAAIQSGQIKQLKQIAQLG